VVSDEEVASGRYRFLHDVQGEVYRAENLADAGAARAGQETDAVTFQGQFPGILLPECLEYVPNSRQACLL